MTDLVGKKLKDFYVLRRLGCGAMAEVYLARQLSLARQVALKVLNPELARDPNYVRRFHNEACAAAALVHAGIVQIYEVGQQDGVHYIAQEYVDGRNLGELIRSRGSLAPHIVLDILRQVGAALAKAAAQGIVHRDIKPENIMLARSGDVKVADFGLARVQTDGAAALTQVGVAMGTPLYMSPEQIEGKAVDARSDIYSLGVTAYHMLCGEPPFTGDSPLSVAVQHLNQAAPPLAVRTAGGPPIPPRLAQVIARMMAKNPAERHPDPSALLADLNALEADASREGWAAGSHGGAALAEMLQAADERALATNRLDDLIKTMALFRASRGRLRWGAAAALGGALLGAALAAWIRPTPLFGGARAGPPRSDNVWGQLYHAKVVDTEDAWRAVTRYFPDAGDYYHSLADQGLVYHYLTRSAEYEKALTPLRDLAASPQPTFQAFGLAGLVVANAQLGRSELARRANQQLSTDLRSVLESDAPRMAELLDQALAKLENRQGQSTEP
jgi:serine/threonine-protein kinase